MQLEEFQTKVNFNSYSAPRHNLPIQPTPLIGRQIETKQAVALLRRADVRLLTLTGCGGVGKTRLALQVATELCLDFEDGVSFVSLASIDDPILVTAAIASALKIADPNWAAPFETLKEYLAGKRLLLVLDTFEQVGPAAPQISELIEAAPGLKVLITSRNLLQIYGEHEMVVQPLTFPLEATSSEDAEQASFEYLDQYESIKLFVQRSLAVRPDFALTAENIGAVAEICAQLDGLPLAIELAAVRSKLLTPQELLARLNGSSGYGALRLLTSGSRNLPARQQSLRSNLAWSYENLESCEKTLFARLAVFAGGCTLEALETVSGDLGNGCGNIEILDRLGDLLNKSLLQKVGQPDGKLRFAMLKTCHEYALERLAESGEADLLCQRHADYYLNLAETACASGQLDQLKAEQRNLQAALQWLNAQGFAEQAARLNACYEQLTGTEKPKVSTQELPVNVKPVEVPARSYPLDNGKSGNIYELTRREIEVLRLVTQGLTNVQVAEKLVLAPRTVNVHLTSIYSKLGVTSRTAATRCAFDQNLI